MIDEKVLELQKTLAHALGLHWSKFAHGAELQVDIDTFRATLKSDTIFKEWEAEMLKRDFKVAGTVLTVTKKDGEPALSVNFDSDIDLVYQEVSSHCAIRLEDKNLTCRLRFSRSKT